MERTNHKRFWKGGLDMANASQIPVTAERQDGGAAGGNAHHVWKESEKQAFAEIMRRSGLSWDRVAMEWVKSSEPRQPGAFSVDHWMHSALEQAGLGTLVFP